MLSENNFDLKLSYEKESLKFEENLSFNYEQIKNSRKIFDIDLDNNIAFPKKLEVIALLAGLPFSNIFQDAIVNTQDEIKKILGSNLSYMVKKENLGLELLVLKWPEDKRNLSLEKEVIRFIDQLNIPEIEITFSGIQINTDGCILVRGFDSNNRFLNLRKKIFNQFHSIPKKQSGWVHVPIGRILTKLHKEEYILLRDLIYKTRKKNNFPSEKIKQLRMIHEKQWYMEERLTIQNWKF